MLKFNVRGQGNESSGKMAVNVVFLPDDGGDEVSITVDGRSLLEVCQKIMDILDAQYKLEFEDRLIWVNAFLAPFGIKYLQLLGLAENQSQRHGAAAGYL